MTVARIASRAVFAFSSALLVIALCDLWQWFWHAHIRTWHLSLQGLVLLTLMVSLGVVTWKAMRAAREFAETNGQNGLVVYSGYGHLAAACVPTAMVLFISDEGWLLGYNAVLAMALIVCGWQAARYNRGLQVVRSLLVQIVFPFLFVFLGMFAAVHASSEEHGRSACVFDSKGGSCPQGSSLRIGRLCFRHGRIRICDASISQRRSRPYAFGSRGCRRRFADG